MKNLSNKGILAICGMLLIFSVFPSQAMVGPAARDDLKEAIALVEKKDFEGAITLLKRVVGFDDRNADAFNYIGYSYRHLKNYPLALKNYQRALKINPDHKGANEYIGEAYIETGRPEKAQVHLTRLKSICGPACVEYRELKEALDSYLEKRTRRKGNASRW